MNFNKHSELDGLHAFLGASKYSWINYDNDKLEEVYLKALAKQKGTEYHDLACKCIKLGVRLEENSKTLNMYVNDAIDFKMIPEQPLFYSKNCFGTADTISFNNKKLRIHDLKTGVAPASFSQLEIYSSLFCLEYDVDPNDIDIELRIYQMDEIGVLEPEKEKILYIMNKIVTFDYVIERLREENL